MIQKIDFNCLQSQYENNKSQDYKKIVLVDSYIQPASVLLDIGSGTGSFLELVEKKFQFIFAVENDEQALTLLRNKFSNKSKIKIIPQSITELFKDDTNFLFFDTITCLDVLEHISLEECQFTIKKIFEILKPNGFFIISVPGIFEKIRIYMGKSPTHLHSHSSYGWAKMLQNAGFKILIIQTVEFPLIDHILFRKYLHLFGKCCVIVAVKPEDNKI